MEKDMFGNETPWPLVLGWKSKHRRWLQILLWCWLLIQLHNYHIIIRQLRLPNEHESITPLIHAL